MREQKLFLRLNGSENPQNPIQFPRCVKGTGRKTKGAAFLRSQKAVSKRVVLRNTPKLTFKHDNSAQRGVDMVNLLDDIEQNLPKAPPLPEGEFDPEI